MVMENKILNLKEKVFYLTFRCSTPPFMNFKHNFYYKCLSFNFYNVTYGLFKISRILVVFAAKISINSLKLFRIICITNTYNHKEEENTQTNNTSIKTHFEQRKCGDWVWIYSASSQWNNFAGKRWNYS